MSLKPTNSKISEYASTKRFPQKLVPRMPVPTRTTLSFFEVPKLNALKGNALYAANILMDARNWRLEFFMIFKC
jgi:hypothetical protein